MFFFFHKLLVLLAALSMINGVSAAVFFRSKPYWLKIHKSFNSSAGIFLFAGVLMAALMVFQQEGRHLNGLHPVIGLITFGLTVVSVLLGFYQFRAGARIKSVKSLHRALGRLTVIMIIGALISGLIYAGII